MVTAGANASSQVLSEGAVAMDATHVAGVIAGITGGWSIGPATRAADLHAARLALAAAADIGKPAAELDPAVALKPIAAVDSTLASALTDALAAPPPARLAFVESRLAASLANPSGTPAWAHGMTSTERLGP